MKIAIMQPYFLPYIGYFQLINTVDRFIVLDDVNYIKKGFINRNNILLNNQTYRFVLPLNKASQNKIISETELLNDDIAINNLLSTFQLAYKNAPFYSEIYPLIEDILKNKETDLSKYIFYSIRKICTYLQIDTELISSSSNFNNSYLKGQDRIIDIVKLNNGLEYINSIGGIDLYDFSTFYNHQIQLCFLKTNEIVYKQFDNNFVSNLSIIDVLMFNSLEDCRQLLTSFNLIKE